MTFAQTIFALTIMTETLRAGVPTPPRPSLDELLAVEHYELDNGLAVALHVDRSLPLVATSLACHLSDASDDSEHALVWLTHMYMMDVHDRDLTDQTGTSTWWCSTALDTFYLFHGAANQLSAMLWSEARLISLSGREIDSHRLAAWRSRAYDYVAASAERQPEVMGMLLAGSGLRSARRSWHEDIHDVRIRDLRRMIKRHHRPANASLVLAGDLPEDVRAQIESAFGSLPAGKALTAPPAAGTRRQAQLTIRGEITSRAPMIHLVWRTPPYLSPADTAANLAADALVGGPSVCDDAPQRAAHVLQMLCAQQVSHVQGSEFHVVARGQPSVAVEEVLAVVESMIEEVGSRRLSADEVEQLRRRHLLHDLSHLDDLTGRVARIQTYLAANKAPNWLAEDHARYERVDAVAIQNFVGTYLSESQRVTVILSSRPRPS